PRSALRERSGFQVSSYSVDPYNSPLVPVSTPEQDYPVGRGSAFREDTKAIQVGNVTHGVGISRYSSSVAESTELLLDPLPVALKSEESSTPARASKIFFEPAVPPNESENVKVVIRVRPLNSRENETGGDSCLQVSGTHSLRLLAHPEPQQFTFDHVASNSTTQEALFRVAGRPIVDNCLAGYNSSIFAYGQTGSGKTHTMLGQLPDLAIDSYPEERGIIPRVFEHLFTTIQQAQEESLARDGESAKFVCKCSFLEIYNETITDLLDPSVASLQIREDIKHGVYVENLREESVHQVADTLRLVEQGAANRRVGETRMNRESSRSHSVFTCVLESKQTINGVTNIRHSRLNLVDLAGSERQKTSGAVCRGTVFLYSPGNPSSQLMNRTRGQRTTPLLPEPHWTT
ncbi:hypothetical protein CYMTET_27925, partial [Cymbomonas tetramitiformis]